jgi:tetratricopeptide (TPR) repeat protein
MAKRSSKTFKKLFNQGLLAEKAGDFKTADTHYQEALMLLPELTETRMRLSLLSVKTENWNQVIHYLEKVPGQQANYLRGFAYFKQNNLQQADREWQSLTHPQVKEQRLIFQKITQRQRLLEIREIEEYVNNNKLKLALSSSSNFIKKFGVDPIVKSNLEDHIQPRLESEIWQEKDFVKKYPGIQIAHSEVGWLVGLFVGLLVI